MSWSVGSRHHLSMALDLGPWPWSVPLLALPKNLLNPPKPYVHLKLLPGVLGGHPMCLCQMGMQSVLLGRQVPARGRGPWAMKATC